MEVLDQLLGGDPVKIEVGINQKDLLTATAYLSVGVFAGVLVAVLIANKI